MRYGSCVLICFLAMCGLMCAQNPVPFVNNPLAPASAAPGSAGFQLTVNGTGFLSASVVNWNGSARATTFISASQLQATILATDLASTQTVAVTVVNPNPGGGVSNRANFNVTLPSPSVGFTASTTNETKNCNSTVLFPQLVADFNGDGKQDVAGTVCGQGFVYVALGNGDGTFQAPIMTAIIPIFNGGMTVADFNGDGKMDIAIIDEANTVGVLLGNGDGTFQPIKNFLTGVNPASVAAADVNGDGKLDLVLVATSDNNVNVLLGNGDGTFQPHIDSPTGGVDPDTLAIGDFNRDGKLDVAVGEGNSEEVTIMFGNGDGTFTFNQDYFVNMFDLTAVDLNEDGILDLVGLGTPLSGGVSGVVLLLGNSDGTFQTPITISPAQNVGFQSFGVADLNGDGRLDIWTVGRFGENEGDSIISFLGNGDGTFQAPIGFNVTQQGFTSGPIVEGDFNNDGKPDFQDANSCLGINCTLVAIQSPVVIAPSTVAFGTTLIGIRTHPQVLVLTNAGLSAITISQIAISGSNAADFKQNNNCPPSLASGASCTIGVAFRATFEDVFETATLTVSDSGPGGGQTASISGTGTYISLSSPSLAFGSVPVGQNSTLVETLTNTSTSKTLTFSRIVIPPGPESKMFTQTNNCKPSLAPGAQCQITVTFAPTSTGLKHGKMIEDFGGDVPPMVKLTGTGT